MGSICYDNHTIYITLDDEIYLINLENQTYEQISFRKFGLPFNKGTKSSEVSAHQEWISRCITPLEISKNKELIAVATESKHVLVFNRKFQLKKTFNINRTASKLCFTPTNDILVADKSGDVYLYEDNKSTLLLGHRSVILDMVLSNCGKYIITCDRDEKIRVSCYPNCYIIVSYCLGHSEFVIKTKLLNDKVLVSASGDGTVRFWDFMEGKELNLIDTNSYIDDKGLIGKFASRFEGIKISALPVSDMDLYTTDKHYLAVSIGGCDLVHIYSVDCDTLSYTYLHKFVFEEQIHFCLGDNLYTFGTKVKAFLYTKQYSEITIEILEKFNNKHSLLQNLNDSLLQTLYKKKYDNVQEYLERKKLRIEVK